MDDYLYVLPILALVIIAICTVLSTFPSHPASNISAENPKCQILRSELSDALNHPYIFVNASNEYQILYYKMVLLKC